MRFDNIDERTVIKSANDEYDDKRNMYSPEIFLSDDAFDPDLKYLNSPATIDVLGKCCLIFKSITMEKIAEHLEHFRTKVRFFALKYDNYSND